MEIQSVTSDLSDIIFEAMDNYPYLRHYVNSADECGQSLLQHSTEYANRYFAGCRGMKQFVRESIPILQFMTSLPKCYVDIVSSYMEDNFITDTEQVRKFMDLFFRLSMSPIFSGDRLVIGGSHAIILPGFWLPDDFIPVLNERGDGIIDRNTHSFIMRNYRNIYITMNICLEICGAVCTYSICTSSRYYIRDIARCMGDVLAFHRELDVGGEIVFEIHTPLHNQLIDGITNSGYSRKYTAKSARN